MRIRVWNAYASNNSGSYTIVGRLPSAEVAERTAQELREMIDAHTAWRAAQHGKTRLEESPLALFCRKHGLTWSDGDGDGEDWPQYSDDNRPGVVVAGTRIVVHHEYTVSLPPTFGELFYKRGGRVEHEEEHAHAPIVVTARFYWGWSKEERAAQATELPRLLAALTAPEGLLVRGNRQDVPSAWRVGGDGFEEAPLTVGVVFDDLIEGITELRTQAEARAAKLELRLAEAASEEDPLVHLRPSAPAIPRFDVVLTDVGEDRAGVVEVLCRETRQGESMIDDRLQLGAPITSARAVAEPRAHAMVAALEGAGAKAELRRNDG